MTRFYYSLGRILLSLIFLGSALTKIADPAGTQAYMASFGLPQTGLLFAGAVVTELVGGLSLLLGLRARWSAVLLLPFLLSATLIFHTNVTSQGQLVQLLKNFAIMGGLLIVLGRGSGTLSIDAWLQERKKASDLEPATWLES